MCLDFIHHCHCDNLKINSGQNESVQNKETRNGKITDYIKTSNSLRVSLRNQICIILCAAMVILRIAKNARNSKQVLLICLLNIIWESEKRKHDHNDSVISD